MNLSMALSIADSVPLSAFNGSFLSVLPGALQIMVSDQGVTNGGTMTRADQSGNGKDYTATTTQPTTVSTLNGRSVLTFAAASALLSSLNVDQTVTPWEFAAVLNVTSWLTNGRILGNSTADSCVVWAQTATPNEIGMYAGFAGPISSALPVGTWGLLRGAFTNSTADFIRAGAGVAVTSTTAGSNPSSLVRIGGSAFSTLPMQLALLAIGPVGFSGGAAFRTAIDSYYNGLVLHP